MTRAYHGEQIKERHWQRLFSRRIPAVVPMDHNYLAANDGSEQAMGRGSGLDTEPLTGHDQGDRRGRDDKKGKDERKSTPYMQMAYHTTERRLDTAIFRALFASSARQARQFVTHGSVKVNGKKMIYPGYLLNPGDMFQVEPERVLWGTGAPKGSESSTYQTPEDEEASLEESEEFDEDEEADVDTAAAEADGPSKNTIKDMIAEAKTLLESNEITAKGKQRVREFTKDARRTMSRTKNDADADTIANLTSQLATLKVSTTTPDEPTQQEAHAARKEAEAAAEASEQDQKLVSAALERIRENPPDPTKPYATPWRPRDYMSAFAFIPRYLEVNQNICAAVYLRHPVARPGLAEVPTPFNIESSQLAFNWYLRRR